jgi:hypothetical protein
MARAAREAAVETGPACGPSRLFAGSRGQIWADVAIMCGATVVPAFLHRALRHHWPSQAAVALLAAAVGLIGWLFLRQLFRGERGWMFYTAMLLFGVLSPGGDTLLKAGVTPFWMATVALLAAAPAALGIVGAVRIVQALDEMWRQINYRALAFAFITTLTAVLVQWVLARLGVEVLSWRLLLLLMVALWGVGMLWASRRLR